MALHSLPPYEVTTIDELNYEFTNRDGIKYHLFFMPVFGLYPDLVNTYSFSIEREGTNPYKSQLVKAFGELLTRDFYEIVI